MIEGAVIKPGSADVYGYVGRSSRTVLKGKIPLYGYSGIGGEVPSSPRSVESKIKEIGISGLEGFSGSGGVEKNSSVIVSQRAGIDERSSYGEISGRKGYGSVGYGEIVGGRSVDIQPGPVSRGAV